MDRLFRLLDTLLGLAFASALMLGVLSALPLSARAAEAGTAAAVGEQRPVGEFQGIAVAADVRLTVRQGSREAVEVRADAALLPLLETVVEDSGGQRTLHIRWKKGSVVRHAKPPTVEVTVVRLQSLRSAGSSQVRVEALQATELAVAVAGSGDVDLADLRGQALSLKIAGSGQCRAAGRVERLKVGISGSGDVRADTLQADEVSVSVAGSGDVSVHAVKTLAVSIAGSGDVVYRGDAQVTSKVAGSGSVRRRN